MSGVEIDGGDCFQAAAALAPVVSLDPRCRVYIVHGIPTGQGPIEGVRFWHAWVEAEHRELGFAVAIDYSNGQQAEMPRNSYYKVAQLDEGRIWRFTLHEALERMQLLGHYGPWVYGYQLLDDVHHPGFTLAGYSDSRA